MNQPTTEAPTEAPSPPRAKRKREKRPPLWWRITFEEHMVALVRLLGQEGLRLKDVRERAKPLIEKFGREHLQEAADEITECDGDGDNAVLRLTEQARKLAVHLIGSPPPADITPTGDSTSAPLAPLPTPSHSEADVSTIPEDADELEEAQAETSDPKVAPHDDAEHRDWVNYETQCIYHFLIQDQDFLGECQHLAAICRKRAASAEDVKSDSPEESNHETSRLAGELERFVREFNPLADDSTPFAELLDAALGNVDWFALAEFIAASDGQNSDPQ